jgi:hypothetical protein
LAKYHGQKIVSVDAGVIANFERAAEKPAAASAVTPNKEYPNGTLIRASDGKIYVLVNGKKHHIMSLVELSTYHGRKIIVISDTAITQYPTI